MRAFVGGIPSFCKIDDMEKQNKLIHFHYWSSQSLLYRTHRRQMTWSLNISLDSLNCSTWISTSLSGTLIFLTESYIVWIVRGLWSLMESFLIILSCLSIAIKLKLQRNVLCILKFLLADYSRVLFQFLDSIDFKFLASSFINHARFKLNDASI